MTIAKKYAQQYMPNGELSLEQVIQAAIDEATEIRKQEVALILTGAHARIRQLEGDLDEAKSR